MCIRQRLIVSMICVTTFTTSPAFAHSGAGGRDPFMMIFELLFISSTTAGQIVTGVGASISLSITPAVGGSIFFSEAKGDKNPRVTEQLRLYMTAQRVQLLEDLSVGAGQSIDDLASLGQVPKDRRAEFGVALRRQRATLAKPLLATESIHTQHASRFAAAVDDILIQLARERG